MSTPAQKANLARIRDNQRRSRARRREYIQELEQRLRAFELQGVEASAEVQMAARRVAEENRQLRELLNKHGFGDDYISRYLQVGAASMPDARSPRFVSGDPGSSVQSLQHLIAPRRPAGLEAGVSYPLPNQVVREMSTTSASSGSSATWDHQQQHPAMPSYGHHSQVVPVGTTTIVSQPGGHQSYTAPTFSEGQLPPRSGPEAYHGLSSPKTLLSDLPSQSGSTHPVVSEHHEQISYSVPIHHYQVSSHRDFPLPGSYY